MSVQEEEAVLWHSVSRGRHSGSTSRSLSTRWMVSIIHKVLMYIVLLTKGILNSHWMKTVTATTPIGPSIEAHLYPWVFEEIFSPSLLLCLPLFRPSVPFLPASSPLCIISSISLFCSLFYFFFASCLIEKRRTASVRASVDTYVRVADTRRERIRARTVYVYISLVALKTLALFVLTFLCSSFFPPPFDLHTCRLPLHYNYNLLFASVSLKQQKWKKEGRKKEKKWETSL